MIELGSKVKCKYTGFTGIAVSRIQFINGCTQYEVLPKIKKEGIMVEGVYVDEQSLMVIKPKKKKVTKKSNGGPMTKHVKIRGY